MRTHRKLSAAHLRLQRLSTVISDADLLHGFPPPLSGPLFPAGRMVPMVSARPRGGGGGGGGLSRMSRAGITEGGSPLPWGNIGDTVFQKSLCFILHWISLIRPTIGMGHCYICEETTSSYIQIRVVLSHTVRHPGRKVTSPSLHGVKADIFQNLFFLVSKASVFYPRKIMTRHLLFFIKSMINYRRPPHNSRQNGYRNLRRCGPRGKGGP